MEKQLTFVPNSSLAEMALRKVIINLWTEDDSLANIEKFLLEFIYDGRDKSKWDVVDQIKREREEVWEFLKTIDIVKSKVLELAIPKSLKPRMLKIDRFIGLEIIRWQLLFHEINIGDSRKELNMHVQELCWTSSGTIDYRKTAGKLAHLETIDKVKRFRLACLYCLEEDIPLLWEEISEEYKSRFTGFHYRCFSDIKEHLEFYWAHVLKGKESNQHCLVYDELSIYKTAFKASACGGIKAATEYFFEKLPKEDRDSVLFETACAVATSGGGGGMLYQTPKHKCSDVLSYLLSIMTPVERMKILKRHPGNVLRCLLDWPCQDIFLDIADIIWTFLPKSRYSEVLGVISEQINNTGYYIPKLLQEFYLRSPSYFRKLLVFQLYSFFSMFTCAPDIGTLKVIFRNMDTGDRLEFISSSGFSKLLYIFIKRYKWRVVEVCLREVLRSSKDIVRLKRASRSLCEDIAYLDAMYTTRRLKRFYELLDTVTASIAVKRSSHESQPKVRKLCTGERKNV